MTSLGIGDLPSNDGPEHLSLSIFEQILETLHRRQISEDEAIRRIRSLRPLNGWTAKRAADRAVAPPEVLDEAAAIMIEDLAVGPPASFSTLERRRNHALLIFESLRPRDGHALGSGRAVTDLANATIDVLTEFHDPALMSKLTQLVEAFVAERPTAESMILAGRAYLDPFSLGPGEYDYHHCLRMRQLRQAWRLAPADHFPDHHACLDRAAELFQQAARSSSGQVRGRALAYGALVALTGQLADRPVDSRQVNEMIDEAAALLPPWADPTIWARLPPIGDTPEFVRDPGYLVAEFGVYATSWLFVSALETAVARGERTRIAHLSELLFPYLPRNAMERAKIALLRGNAHNLPGDTTSCRDHPDVRGPLAYLDRGRPIEALHAIYHVDWVDDVLTERLQRQLELSAVRQDIRELFRLTLAEGALDLATVLDDSAAGAIKVTARVACNYMTLPMQEAPMLCIQAISRRLEENPQPSEPDAAQLMVAAPMITSWVGANSTEPGKRLWQSILFQLPWTLADAGFPEAVVDSFWLIVQQLAKGYTLRGAMVQQWQERDRLTIKVSSGLRADVAIDLGYLTRRSGELSGADSPAEHHRLLAQLGTALWTAEMNSGSSPEDFSANGRRLYHNQLMKLLGRAALLASNVEFRKIPQVQQVLGGSTLLTLLAGRRYGDLADTLRAQIVSAQSVESVAIPWPAEPPPVETELSPYDASLDLPTGFADVPFIVDQLQDEPFGRLVSRQAEEGLRGMATELAPVLAAIARQSDGGMLYIWPHGASHILPFWLLPFEDGIIADRFTVCLLPCLEAMFWSNALVGPPAVFVIASAAGGVPYGLSHEPSTEENGAAIAAIFGSEPLLGDEATPEAFLKRAGQAPYIHLGAHGTHDADAPMFHCLFLSGEKGRLFADHILQCDLRAVRLVTVEACESLLVRFDAEDNLVGLPSVLLRAGAGSVIGALWSVRPEVSALFFLQLYKLIHAGSSVAVAFGAAQRETRGRFPRYLDWGTFCMVGYGG